MSRILKIGMVDADLLCNGTRHPNLAQMKISAYCKEKGHCVKLLFEKEDYQQYDLIVISKVFSFTTLPNELESLLIHDDLEHLNTSIVDVVSTLSETPNTESPTISIGGTGFFEFGGRELDYEIEHHMPDYTLYNDYVNYMIDVKNRKKTDFLDYTSYSIGFASRGCFRKCPFCVNRKYDHAFRHAPISEFFDESRPKIYLWDDNVLALPENEWMQIFEELKRTERPYQFRQGLDIRLMTDKAAKIITTSKFDGDYIFAFDHYPRDKDAIESGLKMWRKYCYSTTKLYVLCAFTPYQKLKGIVRVESDENAIEKARINAELDDLITVFERIKILMHYGCIPYIMRYEYFKTSHFKDMYIQIARWCNQPEFLKKKSFREYCIANKDYSNNENCKTYKTMVLFEEQYPDVAKKYFDMKFSELNAYENYSSYFRESQPCPVCITTSITWDNIVDGSTPAKEMLKKYYSGKLDSMCLTCTKKKCSSSTEDASKRIVGAVLYASVDSLIAIIDSFEDSVLKTDHIPQPGKTVDFIEKMDTILYKTSDGEQLSYDELGKRLGSKDSPNARKKYGETYSKFASLLDLTVIEHNPTLISISPVGRTIALRNNTDRQNFYRKQILRIPVIQNLIRGAKNNKISIREQLEAMKISPSTVERRLSSVVFMLRLLSKLDSKVLMERLQNIIEFE